MSLASARARTRGEGRAGQASASSLEARADPPRSGPQTDERLLEESVGGYAESRRSGIDADARWPLQHTYAPYAAFAFDDDSMPPSSSRNFSTICPSQMTCITLNVSKPPINSFTRNRLWMSGSLSKMRKPSRQ